MSEVIFETIVQILSTLLLTMIGVAGAWLMSKIAKRDELSSISIATDEVFKAAQITVGELQQTIVDGWKAANADGKLTDDEIKHLGSLLVQKSIEKLSEPTKKLLTSAGVDISAIITGVGESLIQSMKR